MLKMLFLSANTFEKSETYETVFLKITAAIMNDNNNNNNINSHSNKNSNNNDTFDSYCDENGNDEYENENNGTEYSSTDELEENEINDSHFKLINNSNSKRIEFNSSITSKVDLSQLLQQVLLRFVFTKILYILLTVNKNIKQTLKEVQYLKDECNILTEILLRKRYKNISEALPFNNKRAGNSRKRKIVEE